MSRMILAGLFIRSQLVDKPFKAVFAYSFKLLSSWPISRIPFEHQVLSSRGWQGEWYLRMATREQLEQDRGKSHSRRDKSICRAERRSSIHLLNITINSSKPAGIWPQHHVCLSASAGQSITVCSDHYQSKGMGKARGF